MYKLQIDPTTQRPCCVTRMADGASIPFAPANRDFQTFKTDLESGVELQDAEGNVMTQEQVAAFLVTLP